MGFRFRKSIKVLPGLRLNLSRSGISANVGVRGANVSVGRRGTHVNVGIPGSGISYRERVDTSGGNEQSHTGDETARPAGGSGTLRFLIIAAIIIGILYVAGSN